MSKNNKHIKEIVIWLLKSMMAFSVSLGILSLLGLVYQHSGVHITNLSGATDYQWEPFQYKSTMVENYSWIQMDEQGFNNAYPKKKEYIDILLMGSSHMEAVEIASNKNLGYLLNDKLNEYYTYNIGTSGHTIYTCIKNMEAAVAEYNPEKYVILEIDRLIFDETDMNKVLAGEYKTIPSYDSGLLYILQKRIPAVKNIYNQLDLWRKVEVNYEKNDDIEEIAEFVAEPSYVESLSKLLKMAKAPVEKNGASLIIFYQPLTQIDKSGNWINTTDENAKKVFEDICNENDITFVDMSKAFESLYLNEHKLAHGFYNTAVGVGHLNEDGHRVIADELVKYICGE